MSGRATGLLVAVEDFWAGETFVRAGDTFVAGHPIPAAHASRFRPHGPPAGALPDRRPASAGAERAVRPPGSVREP